jgi:hypothetical protein
MSRYIDADKLKEECYKFANDVSRSAMAFVQGQINAAPTVDVVEVRHGHWEQNPFFKSIYYCSECGRHIEDGSNTNNPSEHFPYCHCGAKMDGRREDCVK